MLAKKLLESIPQAIRVIRKLSTESFGGTLTLQQLRILYLIREGQGQTQMSETLDVSLPAISKMIAGLENRKFVIKKAGPDRRIQNLFLTSKGNKSLDKITKFVTDKLDVGIQKISPQDREQLLRGLIVLDELMKNVKEV